MGAIQTGMNNMALEKTVNEIADLMTLSWLYLTPREEGETISIEKMKNDFNILFFFH